MYFFTSDEHYGHKNILKFCNRPFNTIEEMDEILIQNHNNVVGKRDIVIHAGDFTLRKNEAAQKYIKRLNGTHIFLMGSHDRWMYLKHPTIWQKLINKTYIVVCHYAMRVWPRSHYGSWQLYGHSHGNLSPLKNQWDIGVDNNNYFPISFDQVGEIMANLKDNQLNYRLKNE